MTVSPGGERTITVEGQWEWTTQTECPKNRDGVGYQVAWFDGNTANAIGTSKSPDGVIYVGDGVDNIVHSLDNLDPLEPNLAFNGVPASYLSHNTTNRAPNTTDAGEWVSNCNNENPTTHISSGTWGPISHTYPATFTGPIKLCPLMYDPHGKGTTSGGTKGTSAVKDITAGGSGNNEDNSYEGNGTGVTGNNCLQTSFPSISTNASSGVPLGGQIHDVAHLTGGSAPTGTITFKLYAASDTTCTTALNTVTATVNKGNGDYESPPVTPGAPGSYQWTASYGGDENNSKAGPTACNDTNETSIVEKAEPKITTSAVTPVTVGANIHDTATITGLVAADGTGKVTFKAYSDSKCETASLFESTNPTPGGISANGNVPSSEYTTKAAGSVFWVANYSGDKNNQSATTKCGDANETSIVNPAKPAIKTTAVTGVTVGGKIKDVATITGLVNAEGTGTVTFKLYSDSGCKTEVAAAKSTSTGVSGSGTVEKESAEFTTTAAGTYYWTASYSGDKNNEAKSTPCEDTNETSIVNPAKPAIKTSATSSVTVGGKIHDTATITGLVNAEGTGTVTFKLFSDSGCKTEVAAAKSTSTGVSGSGTVEKSSAEFTTTAAGTYYWTASYSGDKNNEAKSTPCEDTNETSIVNPAKPAITTSAVTPVTVGGKIKDVATITGLVNAEGTGTVTFKLYSDSGCRTEVAAAKSTSTGVSGSGTVAKESAEFTTTAAGTYYWTASYSGDKNNEAKSTPCEDTNETSIVTMPAFTIEKLQELPGSGGFTTATLTGKLGQTVNYEIIVKNTGTVPLTFSNFTDAHCDAGTIAGGPGAGSVAPGASTTYTCDHVLTSVGSYVNEATDTGTPPEGPTITHTSNKVIVNVPSEPAFTIEKLQELPGSGGFTTATLTGKLGQTVSYEIIVRNTGNVSLTFSNFTDAHCDAGTIAGGPGAGSVAPGASTTYTCDHVLNSVGSYVNEATDTGTPPEGPTITHTSNKVIVNVPSEPAFTIEKLQELPGSGGFTKAKLTGKLGQTVSYEIIVRNTGNVSLTFSSFTDAHCDAGTISGGPGVNPVAPGASTTYTCDHVLTSIGIYINEASDTGTPPEGPPITHTSPPVEVEVPGEPAFTIEKLQELPGSGGFTSATLTGKLGQTVSYEIIVRNTGNVSLTFSSFTDAHCDAGTISGGPGVTPVAPGGSTTYTCDHVLNSVGSYVNEATDTGTPPGGPPITNTSNKVVVNVPSEPGISVLKEQQIAGSGASFTSAPLSATVGQQINYRITVRNTGNVSLTLSFSDPHCDAGTVTGPTGTLNLDGTLPPAGTVLYFCSHVLQAGDSPQFFNTVTVTGQPPSGPPVSGTSTVVTNVAKQVVAAVCSVSEGSISLQGVGGSKRKPFTVRISALGIKQITFYLDGRKLKTLTKAQAKNGQFTIKIDPRKLSYGAHRVSVKTIMSDANCAKLARAGVFVHPRPPVVKPKFTG